MTIIDIIKKVGQVNKVAAEWLTIEETESYTRIKRTAIYTLINEGLIESMELKVRKSNKRGTRLVYLPSLRSYMLETMRAEEKRSSQAHEKRCEAILEKSNHE